jgi:hypothetical protein
VEPALVGRATSLLRLGASTPGTSTPEKRALIAKAARDSRDAIAATPDLGEAHQTLVMALTTLRASRSLNR